MSTNHRLSPIPTPPARRWRQLRLQFLPGVMFGLALLAAGTLWTQWVAPPTLIGEAEAVRAEVRMAQAGTLAQLEVDLLQPVAAGQVLGYQWASSPRILDASLALIRAEIEVIRSTLDPVVGQQRTRLDFDRLQLDWMAKRAELAALQGEAQQAEISLARSSRLHGARMISDDEFESVRNTRDTLNARLKAHQELIASLEPSIRAFPRFAADGGDARDGLQAAITHKEQELRLLEAQLGPVPLLAPIDGVITQIYRRSGETVGAAEPVLQISATRSERIIGFVRQPATLEPAAGMLVEVRTRAPQRRIGTAQVMQVGQQLEPIAPTLLAAMRLPVTTIPTEFGIRVHVSPPSGLDLRPGEQVDLILRD